LLLEILTDQEGPANWSESYPNCGRHNQSPINFDTTDENTVKRDENLEEILFVDYEDYPPNKTWQLLNNGHTGANIRRESR
jgi:Eukaryotic-type carbonic anhydrase